MTPDATVLYDADCGLCRWTLAKVLAWDRQRRLRPLALQAREAERLLGGMSPEERMRSWHLVTGQKLYSAGSALAPLMRLLPLGKPLAAAFGRFPRVSDRLYFALADNRVRLGRLLPRRAVDRATRRIAEREGAADPGAGGP